MTPRRRVPIRVRQHDQQGGTGAIHAALATPAVATTPEQPTTARPARAEGRLNQQVHIDARQRIRIFAEDYFPVPPVLPAQPLQSATPAVATNQTTAIELDPDAEYYPYGLLCPITLSPFVDPVRAADGYTYEKAAIKQWFRERSVGPNANKVISSPVTSVQLSSLQLQPDFVMKALIAEFKQNILPRLKELAALKEAAKQQPSAATAAEEPVVALPTAEVNRAVAVPTLPGPTPVSPQVTYEREQQYWDELLFVAVRENNVADIQRCLAQSANIDVRRQHMTPLHVAVLHRHVEAVRALLAMEPMPNVDAIVTDTTYQQHMDIMREGNHIPWQATALIMAVRLYPDSRQDRQASLAIIKMLCEQGHADVNAVDCLGRTALHWAGVLGDKLLVDYLFSQHIDFRKEDNAGKTALALALQCHPANSSIYFTFQINMVYPSGAVRRRAEEEEEATRPRWRI